MKLRRWNRAWMLLLVLLFAAPLAALLPPVQRAFFPLRFEADLLGAARSAGVDPALLAAVALRESGFRPDAVSDQGAVGLMQLLPSTAEWAAGEAGVAWEGTDSLRRPGVSLRLGAWYLAWLLERFEGDPVLALAAYNGGQHTVDRWRGHRARRLAVEELPYPETRYFVQRVLQARERYARLYPALAP